MNQATFISCSHMKVLWELWLFFIWVILFYLHNPSKSTYSNSIIKIKWKVTLFENILAIRILRNSCWFLMSLGPFPMIIWAKTKIKLTSININQRKNKWEPRTCKHALKRSKIFNKLWVPVKANLIKNWRSSFYGS